MSIGKGFYKPFFDALGEQIEKRMLDIPVMPRGARSASEWQPIETAPRGWADIILFDPECDPPVFQGYFSEKDGGTDCWMDDRGPSSCQVYPTHWMPLPEPPK